MTTIPGWDAVQAMLTERFGKMPDMEAIFFLIGMNEFGRLPARKKFSKEEKQDLMHVAVCHLLSLRGYYKMMGHDEEGWPHYEPVKPIDEAGLEGQENLLKACIVDYFGMNAG